MLHETALHETLGLVSTSTQRASEYRQRMRERGFRPVQIWVPDVRSAAFAAAARRESRKLATADRRSDDMAFVEAISVWAEADDE